MTVSGAPQLRFGGAREFVRRVALLLPALTLLGADRALAQTSLGAGSLPLGYPPIVAPMANPPSPAKLELGRHLFFDRRLSADGTVSCADCHKPQNGFSDAVPISRGAFGRHGIRKTPSLLNVGYQSVLMWDGRAPDLEHQIRLPLTGHDEMAMTGPAVCAVIEGDTRYRAMFIAAFGDTAVTIDRLGQAIATFERAALIASSGFDRFVLVGDTQAISPAAQRGWRVFQDKGCITCHRFESGNPFFTDFEFHNTGIGYDTQAPDLGRYNTTMTLKDQGRFKTPSLVGVAEHAPYMHDGRLQTLRQVIDYYDRGGTPNRFLDAQLKPLRLAETEKSDLIAFLEALSPTGKPMQEGAFDPSNHSQSVVPATVDRDSHSKP